MTAAHAPTVGDARLRGGSSSCVTAAYPSGEVLPENVLRFYLHFSHPMAPHRAPDFVSLRDASGAPDHAAFMWFKQELWNADRTRLTLLIDPGRIKRGVATNLELGPALRSGERFTLTVAEGWPSADGLSTLPAFAKHFRVGAPLRDLPDVGRWTWQPPQPGTTDALEVAFDRPFDRHLLEHALRAVTDDGTTIDGQAVIGENEASWSLTPGEPWPVSGLRIVVDNRLEDVAGNNLLELLDHPPEGTHDDRTTPANQQRASGRSSGDL